MARIIFFFNPKHFMHEEVSIKLEENKCGHPKFHSIENLQLTTKFWDKNLDLLVVVDIL